MMVEAFRRRRDLVDGFFREHLPGVEFVDPVGAFYLFFRVDHFFDEDAGGATAFCEGLLADAGVALVPGEAFGDGRWVRLSYAAADSEIERALERAALYMRRA